MSSIGLNFVSSSWYKIKNIDVFNNIVCLTSSSIIEKYDPLEYQNNPVPINIVDDILGDTLKNQQDMFIHTLMLSLDYTNLAQIRKWIHYFGVLLPCSDELLLAELPEELFDDNGILIDAAIKPIADLFQIAEEIKILQYTAQAIIISANNNEGLEFYIRDSICSDSCLDFLHYNKFYNFLKTKLPDYEFDDSVPSHISDQIPISLDYKDFSKVSAAMEKCRRSNAMRLAYSHLGSELLGKLIEFFFSLKLSHLSPTIKAQNNSFSFSIDHYSLIDIVYFSLALDVSANTFPRKCSAKNCSRYFTPSRNDAIYCSDTCKNRAKQQRHRAKVKRMK